MNTPLSKEFILSNCRKVDRLKLEVLDTIDSTNTRLLNERLEPGQVSVCITEAQEGGRGRRGNLWQSAPNKNVLFSLAWCFKEWPEELTGLSLVVGMLVAEQLNRDHGLKVKVKWPNDLVIDDQKLGGILIELAGSSDGQCQVVIGLGLNVHQPDWAVGDTEYSWTDLNKQGVDLDRNLFIAKLIDDLCAALSAFEARGFTPLVEEWQNFSSYQGRKIAVIAEGGENLSGIMHGVDNMGALILKDEHGELHRFTSSSVSVRLL